jgi:hypothetical protein
MERLANLLSPIDVLALYTEWSEFVNQVDELVGQAAEKAPTMRPIDQDILAMFNDTTMGVAHMVSLSSEEIIRLLGGADQCRALPTMNMAAPRQRYVAFIKGKRPKTLREEQQAGNRLIMEKKFNDNIWAEASLMWHQLQGVYKLMEMMSRPLGQGERPGGLVIADEMGLGKTPQAIAIIATLAHWAELAKKGKPLPSLHGLSNAL